MTSSRATRALILVAGGILLAVSPFLAWVRILGLFNVDLFTLLRVAGDPSTWAWVAVVAGVGGVVAGVGSLYEGGETTARVGTAVIAVVVLAAGAPGVTRLVHVVTESRGLAGIGPGLVLAGLSEVALVLGVALPRRTTSLPRPAAVNVHGTDVGQPPPGREPVVVHTRSTRRRGLVVLLAILILCGVGIGAYAAGRSSVTNPSAGGMASTRSALSSATTQPRLKTFDVSSTSMWPTLKAGDRIVVNRDFGQIHAGTIVVFKRPPVEDCRVQPVPDHVERVVGLPGQTVSARGGQVYITGKLLKEPWLPKGSQTYTTMSKPYTIPAGDYFVMGDNRVNSCDSRIWGPVPRSYIVGKVVKVLTPSTTITTVPTTSPAGFAILAPTTVPPVSAECNLPVTESEDGNWSPLLCSDGGVNVPAWGRYAHLITAPLFVLGRNATESAVIATMCQADTEGNATLPEVQSAESLAGAYYGWPFQDTSRITSFPYYPTLTSNECS